MGLFNRFLGPNIEKLEAKGDVEALLSLLGHEKPDLRLASIKALLRMRNMAVIPVLIEALGAEDNELKTVAGEGLEAFGSDAHTPLAGALGDEQLGPGALDFLVQQKEIPTLIEAFRKGEDAARLRAGGALVEIMPSLEGENRDSTLQSMRAALGDRLPEIRRMAAELLGEMGDERATKALASQLKDGQDEVRKACVKALRQIGAPAIPHILNALDSRSPRARAEAADLLAEMAPKLDQDTRSRVIEDLARASEDRDEHVRSRVGEALKILGA